MATNDKINNRRGLKNVLIARFSAIGDVAMTIPVVYSACRCYPDVNFYLITRPSMTSIFINAPKNLKLIGVDVKEEYKGLMGMRRLLNELRKEYSIDAFVDLHDVLRTHMLRLLCHMHRIPTARINKGRGGKRALTRRRNKVMLPLTSSIARYRETFFRLGLPIQEQFNGLFGGEVADSSMFSEITAPKAADEIWIGIAPFAKHKGKIYPPELMEKVIADLSQIVHAKIFLFGGGKEEQEILGSWAQKYERVVSLADKRYGFSAEMALMSHLNVMVSMDSANMHLASLVGTTVVSIWGATHPYCGFKGWRQNEGNMIQLPMTCRPCSVFGNKPCHRGDYQCLAGIPSQVVIDKIRSLVIHD